MGARRRRNGELVQGVFQILKEAGDPLPAREVLSRLPLIVPPNAEESSEYANRPGVRKYEKTVRFATISAVKAGWLVKSDGKWSLTDRGAQALEQYADPEAFQEAAGRLYRKWKGEQEEEDDSTAEEVESPEVALEEAEDSARGGIIAHLQNLHWTDFQNLVAALLRALGYHVTWVAPVGARGTDIIAYRDPLGTEQPRIRVEVKQRTNAVDLDGFRAFRDSLGPQDVGIFVSLGGFTRDAEEAARNSSKLVTLIDAEKFVALWKQHYGSVSQDGRKLLPLRPVFFLDADVGS